MTAAFGANVIGREVELDAVTGFLDAIAEGPAALLLRGEPGIGKTTIWHAATVRAREAGCAVLSSRPGSAEAELPYVGLGDLFAGVPDDVIGCLPGPQRRALEVALLEVEADGDFLQQRAVASAALNVIVELARSTPVLVAVDDLQWLDRPTLHVLRFALRRIGSARVGILVASRSGATEEDPLRLADTMPARLHRLILGPLELDTLDRVLRVHLQTTFLAPTLRRLYETSEGNPFFALELGRALLDPDSHAVPGQPFPAPSTLPELIAAHLARLPPRVRAVLFVASAAARPTVDLVLATAASEDEGVTALDQAVTAGLITTIGGQVRFTHPLFSSVLYAESSERQRRRLHRRLAGLVADPEEQARHLGLSAAGPDDHIAAALDSAAKRAASRGAPDAAAEFLERAAQLTPPSSTEDAIYRRLDAADQHVAAGDTARGRALLDGVLSISDLAHSRARALHRLGHIAMLEGDMPAVPAILQAGLREVGDDVSLRASIKRDLAWALAQEGAVAEAVVHAQAALHDAETSGEPVLVAEALDHLCMAKCIAGYTIEPELLHRAILLDEQVGTAPRHRHPAIAPGRLPLAMTLKWTDNFDKARELMTSLQTEHREHGDDGALAPVLFHHGELECWAGNWTAAAGLAEASHHLASHTGQAVAERRALVLDVMVASSTGDAKSAYSWGAACLEAAEIEKDRPATIRTLASLGVLELAVGNTERAVGYLDRATDLNARTGRDPATIRVTADAIEARLAVHRFGDAQSLLDELERRAQITNGPWAMATAARCRGLLEASLGRLGDAQSALELAVERHDHLPQPFERARTLLALGTVQRRAKQKRMARLSLEEAAGIFDGLGAVLWAARARAELTRIGGRTASPVTLTATEKEVARLVADGRTNREVALSLFMSVKTVEVNLTRIYRKVGVTSRRELATYMTRPDEYRTARHDSLEE